MNIEFFKKIMKEKKITYEDLAEKAGLSISTIKKIFSGIAQYPRIDTVQAIEKALGLDDYEERIKAIGGFPVADKYAIPLVAEVACGKPVETNENIEGYVAFGGRYDPSELFALRVQGESMKKIIPPTELTFSKEITAVIFDLDGTLFDSMGVWAQIDIDFLGKRGLTPPPDYMEAITPLGFRATAEYTIQRFHLDETPEALMEEWHQMAVEAYTFHVPLKPQARPLLERLKAYSEEMKRDVEAKAEKLDELGYREYMNRMK